MSENSRRISTDLNQEVTNYPPLFSLKRQRGSYWNFIKLIAPNYSVRNWESKDAIAAWCEQCNVKIAYSVGNINSVKSHLRTKHSEYYVDSRNALKKQKKNDPIPDRNDPLPIINQSIKPSTITSTTKKAEAVLIQWTAISLRPYELLEDPGFLQLWGVLNHTKKQIKPPSIKKYKNQILQVADHVTSHMIYQMRNEMEYFAITNDIWTSKALDTYIALTVQYLTIDFRMKKFTLELTPLQRSYTSDNIRSIWMESFSRFQLHKEKLSMVLRDNTSNSVNACKDWGTRHFGSIAHSMHLILGPFLLENLPEDMEYINVGDLRHNTEFLDEEQANDIADYEELLDIKHEDEVASIRKLNAKVRIIMKYIKYSVKAQEKLKTYGTDDSIISITDKSKIRWNTALDVIQAFLKARNGVEQFLSFIMTSKGKQQFSFQKLPSISEAEWVILSSLCVILKPFKDAINVLSNNAYPTLAVALPLLIKIQGFLNSKDLIESTLKNYKNEVFYASIKHLLKACQKILVEKFENTFTGLDNSILWISYLDPRLRGMKHLNAEDRKSARERIIDETIHLVLHRKNSVNSTDSIPMCTNNRRSAQVGIQANDIKSTETNNLYDEDDLDIFDSSQQVQSTHQNTSAYTSTTDSQHALCRQVIEKEFAKYLDKRNIVNPKDDPLEWWRVNQNIYPNLARTSRKWLSVCVTPTVSEREFSSCSAALTSNCEKMLGSTSKAQIHLSKNLLACGLSIDDIASIL